MKTPKVEPKVETEFEIEFKEITHKGLQRMLRTALAQLNDRSKPLHQRKGSEIEEQDEDTEESDKENNKLVELHQERGAPAPIPMTDEDVPEVVADRLPKKKPGKQA
jgi:hypothetical protein